MNNLHHQVTLFFISFLLIIGISLSAQQWVDVMQDSTTTLQQKSQAFDAYWLNKSMEKGKGYKQFKRNEYFLQSRVNQSGFFNPTSNNIQDYQNAQQQMSQQKSIGTAGQWVSLGPNGPSSGSGSGRINCIDFHPTNSNIIIVGAPAGGIWRSTDDGASWSTNTDDLASIGFSDIQFAPSNGNIVYAASGDRDGNDTYTHGILKSTDAGISWTLTNWTSDLQNRRQTYRILVHPTNPDIVYATTSLGLFKTEDGGQVWVRLRVGAYKDIEFKPGDPNTIYLASTSTVAKSTNGGSTFVILTAFSPVASVGRLEIAVTPADPNYLYILAGKSSDNGFGGIYLSTDAGTTFTTRATTPNLLGWNSAGADQGGQAWYDLSLAVSPTNKLILLVGGVNVWKSSNGGSNWSISGHWTGNNAPYVHADCHMIKFSPHGTSNVWACTDGGLSKSTNNGLQWNEKNNLLAIAQMYRLGGSNTNASKIMTGWQDNGSSLMTTSWNKVLGGDGMECIVSHDNNNTLFGSLYYGAIYRSVNSGGNWSEVTNSISEQGAWVTPFIQDPVNANLLYAGYENVWKTANKGNSWTKISSFTVSSKINALVSAPSNSQILWAANSSYLYKTLNGGQNWMTITSLPISGNVNSIAINQTNPNLVWVCISGYYSGEKVFESKNGGISWQNISGSLPNYPANTIVNDYSSPNGLYVGMDMGIYYRDTIIGDWVPFMKDLPNVVVRELEIFHQDNKIRAATYGRGLWESVLYQLANSTPNNSLKSEKNVKIYPNPSKDIIYINFYEFNNTPIQITIYDILGSILFSKTILNNDKTTLNTSQFTSGIYFVEISTDTYNSVNKIVVE